MKNKQTAVEWLIIQIKNDHIDKDKQYDTVLKTKYKCKSNLKLEI